MTHATAAPFCYFAPEFAHRLTAHPLRRRTQVTEDFAIQPEKITPTLDASKWPLLLKNYDKLMVREADHPSARRRNSHTHFRENEGLLDHRLPVSSFPKGFGFFLVKSRRGRVARFPRGPPCTR